jgi:diguanylate cyclase (GGDEF)-like protein/PAS domain S-box-containing protein
MHAVDPSSLGRTMAEVADRLLAPIAVIAADSTLLYVNESGAKVLGQAPERLIGRNILEFVHPADFPRVRRELSDVVSWGSPGGTTTYRVRADDSSDWRTLESIADNLLDHAVIAGILISSRDTSVQVAHERELITLAYVDALTGLDNRAKVHLELDQRIDEQEALAVAFVGLDRFKLINDSLGHTAGDTVLTIVSQRVAAALPPSATLGRFDSDVFVVVLSGLDEGETRELLWRVIERVNEPMFISTHELRIGASVGIAQRDSASTAESLLRDAGTALHRAKATGGHRVEAFESSMRSAAFARI